MSQRLIDPDEDVKMVGNCLFSDNAIERIRDTLLSGGIECDFEATLGILAVIVRTSDFTAARNLLDRDATLQFLKIVFADGDKR